MIDLQVVRDQILVAKSKLDASDSVLSTVIDQVEAMLSELRPGIPSDAYCKPADGDTETEAFWLSFGKWQNGWRILWSRDEEDQDTPLQSASRGARADVFKTADNGHTHLENLILSVVEAITGFTTEREPLVARAQQLSEALSVLRQTR